MLILCSGSPDSFLLPCPPGLATSLLVRYRSFLQNCLLQCHCPPATLHPEMRRGISHLTMPLPCLKSFPGLPVLQNKIYLPRWHTQPSITDPWPSPASPPTTSLPGPLPGRRKHLQYQGCCFLTLLSLNSHFFQIFRLRSFHPKSQSPLPHQHSHNSWTHI